jgi:glutamate N-acetyltransferase/amino-acid N-acetyltransferase
MIHPDMATMLSFITTDAEIAPELLKQMLKDAADDSFNMMTIDGDTSTNDTVLLMANGAAGAGPILAGTEGAELFSHALTEVCIDLAKRIAREGEGSTKLIEVTVEGANTLQQARSAARIISGSSLVKTAVHGNDPNWGRITVALGRSEADVEESKLALHINGALIMENGLPAPFHRDSVIALMSQGQVDIKVNLNLGEHRATAWGCNLSEEYVTFNSAYTT